MQPITRVLAEVVLVCACALPVLAAPPAQAPAEARSRHQTAQLEQLGKVTKASEVIGTDVKNNQDEKLGEVEDLAVDLEAGRIVYVILSSGGILGVGSKSIAVPPRAFTCDETKKLLRLDLDKEKLKGAPEFDMSKWKESWDAPRVTEVYRYYQLDPYFGIQRSVEVTSPTSESRLGYVEKASKLMGMAVNNKQDEKLGDVNNLMVDLEAGRVVHAIVSTGGFLGIGDELSVVPATALHYDNAKGVVHLDTTKEALSAAPRFKSSDWPNLSDPQYAGRVYQSYRVKPYFSTDADNSRINVRDRDNSTLTPLDQGNNPADVEMTRRIRKDILEHKDLSVNAQNIKVITVNGKVTLRGPVANEDERRVLAEIAVRNVQASNVVNQLEVKRAE